MQTYFLGLFAAEAVLLAVAVAFLVAFVQMTASRYTPAIGSLALRDRPTWLLLFVLTGIMLAFGIVCLALSLPPPRAIVLGLTLDEERLLVGASGLALFVLSIGLVVGVVAQAARYGSTAQLPGQVVGSIRPIALLPGAGAGRGGRNADAVMLPVLELVTAATRDGDRPTFTRLFLEIRLRLADWLRSTA